jgi:phage tail sheath protein FI
MGRKKRKARTNPGVYVEEVPSGPRPIEAVGTSTAGFVGLAPLNPARAAVTVLVVAGAVAAVVWAVRGQGG